MNKLEQTNPARDLEMTNRLVGPFIVEQSGMCGFVIRDGDGAEFAWVVGERHARCVVGMLNLGYDLGLLK
jgi:hypothetical protein